VSRGKETRDRIVTTARQLFAEKGYAGATTAEIARRAAIAEGTIYRHFADKNELFIACVTPVVAENGIDISDDADVRTVVRTMLQFRLRLLEQNLEAFNILFTQAAFHPELGSLFVDRFLLARSRRVAPALERLYAQGELRRKPNELILSVGILAAIWAILNFRSVLAGHMAGATASSDELLEDLVDLVLHGIASD
jgi:AcrR family transcriptional regulator